MANRYTKSDIITKVIERHKKQGYSKEELNELRNNLQLDLDRDSVKMINGLSRSKGGLYNAFNYFRVAQKNMNPNRRPPVTPEEVKKRAKRQGENISTADATRKATRENKVNENIAFWETSIAMGLPTGVLINGVTKLGAYVLPKVLASPIVRNAIAKAVEGGAKLTPQLSQAAKTAARAVDTSLSKIGYQVTGRLPRPTGTQDSFNYDMARIAGGMDKVLARSTIPRGPSSRIPPPLSDKIQAGAARIMSEPPVGPASELSSALPASVRANAARIMAEPPVGPSLPVASRSRVLEQLRPTSGRTTGPVQESPVGGVTPLMGQRAAAIQKLAHMQRNAPLSADPKLGTAASPPGYVRNPITGKMEAHWRAGVNAPRHSSPSSPWPGPTAGARGTTFGGQTGAARTARPAGWTPSRGARVSPTVSPHPKYAGRPPTASPHPGANITRHAMAGAMATALFDNLDANQKAVLEEAAGRDWEPYPEEMDVPQYDAPEEIMPSDAPIDETIEEQIAEPGFGRMLGLRRSAEEIERDVAITEALDAGDYDRVATLEKESGPSDWTDSLTQRTRDYTPEQIEAMLSPDVSGSPLDELQGLLGDVEPVNEDSEYMSLMNKGGRVKPKKKKKTKKSSKTSKSYSNKTRKPSRA